MLYLFLKNVSWIFFKAESQIAAKPIFVLLYVSICNFINIAS